MLLSFITDIIPEIKAEVKSRIIPAESGINFFNIKNPETMQETLHENELLSVNNNAVNSEPENSVIIQQDSKQSTGDVSFEVKYKMLLERMQKERTEREMKLKRYNELLFNRSDI